MFEDAKIGDRVWDFTFGWGTIYDIILDDYYPIKVEFRDGKIRSYTFDGFLTSEHITNPTLFWDMIQYKVPEKPFNLESELRQLKITEFKHKGNNHFLAWSNEFKCICYHYFNSMEMPFTTYFTKESIENFLKNIKDKKITKQEFFKAYKNVFGGKDDRGIN